MKYRTFIALDVSEGVREGLSQRCRELQEYPGTITWVAPKVLHVTLNYLGEIEASQMAGVQAVVAEAAAQSKPFDFQVRGLAALPPKGRPRVIWANVIERSGELAALQERVTVGLEALGFPREDRSFRPHVTLARVKFTPATKALRADLEAMAKDDVGLVPAGEVIVFTSDLQADGPIHTPVARAPLGPAGG